MVAMAFNANQYQPQYGGGASLPANDDGSPRRYKGMITASQAENTLDNFGVVKGGYLALEISVIEGPLQGQKMIDRLNLHHTNPKVVEIANKQLSAYCHVLGKFVWQDTQELHNIPFQFDVRLQKEPNPNKYTEIGYIYDINGNEPGKAGAGPQVNQQQPQQPSGPAAGGVQAQGGGWGGNPNPNPNPNGGGYPIDNNVAQPNQGGQQQGWGGPPQGQGPQDQQQPQGQGQPQWGGQPQGQAQGGPQQPNPGWGGQPAGGGAAPGWGQR